MVKSSLLVESWANIMSNVKTTRDCVIYIPTYNELNKQISVSQMTMNE